MLFSLVLPAFTLFLFATTLFFIALRAKNNGVADEGYGIAFMVVVGATLLNTTSPSAYALGLVLCVFVWGVRLAYRIKRKNHAKPEDFRYRAWREAWGRWFLLRSYLQIYLLQAGVVFCVALPVVLALLYPIATPLIPLFALGIALWLIGFFFEVRGDFELDQFLRDPQNKGRIMMSGLWRYSRHPNYFGESLMWWGIALASFAASGAGLVVFISPLLITFLLLFVSGVPMLEKRWAGNPEWEAYRARTSVFIPLPPRSKGN